MKKSEQKPHEEIITYLCDGDKKSNFRKKITIEDMEDVAFDCNTPIDYEPVYFDTCTEFGEIPLLYATQKINPEDCEIL